MFCSYNFPFYSIHAYPRSWISITICCGVFYVQLFPGLGFLMPYDVVVVFVFVWGTTGLFVLLILVELLNHLCFYFLFIMIMRTGNQRLINSLVNIASTEKNTRKINTWTSNPLINMYSQTCIKRSPLGQRKRGLIT
jgi:hypothetical protein